MSDFKFIHRFSSAENEEVIPSLLVWKTCRRQLIFLDPEDEEFFETMPEDQLYSGPEAQILLSEILCGLHSPLFGETEVFGQFKSWWHSLPESHSWKIRNQRTIENLFALVKSVREKFLCGQGSHSYGSLLRRKIEKGTPLDFLGAGNLVQEILPWVQENHPCRIWARDPQKVAELNLNVPVLPLQAPETLAPLLVVAAPLSHEELNAWLESKKLQPETQLFDLRAHSENFQPFMQLQAQFTLNDFFAEAEAVKNGQEVRLLQSQEMIQTWCHEQERKVQIRPYGWDDL